MRNSPARLEPHYARRLLDLRIAHVQCSAEGSRRCRQRRRRPGGVSEILCQAALSFCTYHPSGRCQAGSPWSYRVKADGRWRLFAFAAAEDPVAPASGLRTLCEFLAESSQSSVRRYTPTGPDIDSVIDVRAVFQQGHLELAIEAMPPFLIPRKGRYGLRDYEKMFCPDLKRRHDIFDMRSVDRNRGCIVVVRPDQHVAHVLPFDACAGLAAFFDGFMVGAKAADSRPRSGTSREA
jgi:hypothetical protein